MAINAKIEQGKFYHHFHPIYNLSNWQIDGYEVLLRSGVYPTPSQAFEAAEKENILYELDISSIYNGIYYHKKADFHNQYGKLYINVFLSTILHPSFPAFLNFLRYNFPNAEDTVFEINEAGKMVDLDELKEVCRIIRKLGFQIALVNFGNARISIKEVLEIKPDVIKLDQYFSMGLEKSKEKESVVKLLNQYCKEWNIKLILEGIETPAELAIARYLSIPYGQGYTLAKPEPLEYHHDWMELPQVAKKYLYAFYR